MGNKISKEGEFDPKKMRNKALLSTIMRNSPLDLYLFYWLGYKQVEKTPIKLRFADYWKGENLYKIFERIVIIYDDMGRMNTLLTTPSRKAQIRIENFTPKLLSLTNRGVRIWKQAKEDNLWTFIESIPDSSFASPEIFIDYFNSCFDFKRKRKKILNRRVRDTSRDKSHRLSKIAHIRFSIKLQRGKKKYFLTKTGHEQFRSLLANKKYAGHQDLIEKAHKLENKALMKIGIKVQKQSQRAIAEIKMYYKKGDAPNIVRACTSFFRDIKDYPITEKYRTFESEVKEAHNSALIDLWQEKFDTFSKKIRDLLKDHNHEQAINHGRKFIDIIKSYPNISQLNIFRDTISSLIEPLIIHNYAEQFKTIRDQENKLVSQRDFDTIISKWDSFIDSAENYTDIKDIYILLIRATDRLSNIRAERPHIKATDDYNTLITLAIENYDKRDYETAILCMRKAILVKKEYEKEQMILLKDTGEKVKNVQFIYRCQDLDIEKEIESTLARYRKLYNEGKEELARHILQEAQNLHMKFSKRYRKKNENKCKALMRQIRNGINRIPKRTKKIPIIIS